MANVSSSNGLEKRPKLRFPGFDEPYRTITLGQIASLVNRNDPTSNAPIMMLSAGNGFIMQSEKYSRDNAGQSLKKYILLKKGELAYNHGASKAKQYGCCYELTEDEARIPYVYHCFKVSGAEHTPYVATALNNPKIDRQLKRLVSSSVRMDGLLNISFDDYMSVILNLPSLKEQTHIADFLKKLDERITAQEELVASLKKYKRGVTEAIFTKDLRFITNGVPYPQWDKKYVGDICKIQTGKSNTQDETSQGSYPFYVRSPIVRKSNRYLFDCEAVLTVGDGVGTGKVFHYVTGKFDLHQRVYAMTDFKIVSGKYFYYYFSHFFYDRVMRMTAKTSVDSVRYEMIDKMAIQIPCHEEQQQIVSFLDCLEHSVIEAEKTLNLLEKLKSGCLQQLFI